MKSVSHITPTHLMKHLLKIGFFKRHAQHNVPQNVGLCVSGGPDSMALAYLVKNMPHPYVDGMNAFSPRAFIIDHGARDGSYEEAMWVKDQLRSLHIETDIRSIEWSPSIDPASMQGFEKKARQERYSCLASMAVNSRFLDLFTGHHQDDQVETMITRLLRDKTLNPFSFRGMQTTSALPYGGRLMQTRSTSDPLPSPIGMEATDQLQYEIFHLGLRLHRPLLNFRKNDLIATCDFFKVPYVQDKTNFNPQLTIRNAIRYLRTNHTLPIALQATPLLNSVIEANRVCVAIEEQAYKLFDYILSFNMHCETGVVFLRLKPLPLSIDASQLQGFSFFVQRVINLVTPIRQHRRVSMMDQDQIEFLYALVSRSDITDADSIIISKVVCSRTFDDSLSKSILLTFSRQSISQAENDLLTKPFRDYLQVPSSSGVMSHETRLVRWDRRLWIKITGEKDAIVSTVIRPYNKSDVPQVMAALRKRNMDQAFKKALSTIAPRQSRFTLPVLVVSDEIVAFPTLRLKLVESLPIDWSLRYNRDRLSTQFFFPDIEHEAVISWKLERSTSVTDQEDLAHDRSLSHEDRRVKMFSSQYSVPPDTVPQSG